MKTFLLTLSCFLILLSCNNTNSPKSTVYEYLVAIDNFEFEKANSLLLQNEENVAAFNNIKNFTNGFSETKKQESIAKSKNRMYNIIEKEVSESEALIIATNNEGSFTSVITFKLVKQKGNWFIKSFVADAG